MLFIHRAYLHVITTTTLPLLPIWTDEGKEFVLNLHKLYLILHTEAYYLKGKIASLE